MNLGNFDFSKKVFYHPDRVAELQRGGRPFPVTVEIDLTNACNHRCAFCFYAEHLAADRSALDTAVACRVLGELKELGTRGVSFTGGGEPLLHRDFAAILAHARGLGLDTGLITNGSAITGRLIPALVRDLTWIRVSAAGGDRDSYRAVQGVDHFERVMENVAALGEGKRAAGSRLNLGVRMLVTERNVHSVAGLAARLAPLGVDYLQVAPDQFTSDGGLFWHGEAVRAAAAAATAAFAGTGTKLLTSGYVWHQDKLHVPSACHAHFFQIAILAEGHVAFCKNARGAERFFLGNVNTESLRSIWDGAVAKGLEAWVTPANCGLYCKHIQMNLALEEVLHPQHDMSPNFVG